MATREHALESIVAKPKRATYLADVNKPAWIKIKNPAYSQGGLLS